MTSFAAFPEVPDEAPHGCAVAGFLAVRAASGQPTDPDALNAIRAEMDCDAIIVSGGAARRLAGGNKPNRTVGGWSLLDHAVVATAAAGRILVVGPPVQTLLDVDFITETRPGEGPLSAVAQAAAHVRAPRVLLLAADLPFVGALVADLLNALADDDTEVAVVTDDTGRPNYLVAAWRTTRLRTRLDAIADPANLPMRLLYEKALVRPVPDPQHYAADCDTADSLAAARRRFTDQAEQWQRTTPLAWLPRPESGEPATPS